MSEIRVDSEQELIEKIRGSRVYDEFRQKHLPPKIDREKRAWKLLEEHRGAYTPEVLNRVFDTVDVYGANKRWFGSLLATPNRNLIFESEPEVINRWFEELLFQGNGPEVALNTCLKKLRIKGASKGLATLLLYLSNPEKYNIWVNATLDGLSLLGRIGELRGTEWGENYAQFNQAALQFRDSYHLDPREMDWLLSFIGFYAEGNEGHFEIDEEALQVDEDAPPSEQGQVPVDDEADLEDVVGEPMELQVMRWTPTNEMGVVALFIEFRKQLGFPIVEIIRVRFPDAAVFESSSKGYVRKYIEFEFKSSGYKDHLKSKRRCHYVVCWEDDWKDCPIPVIELKREIPRILATR